MLALLAENPMPDRPGMLATHITRKRREGDPRGMEKPIGGIVGNGLILTGSMCRVMLVKPGVEPIAHAGRCHPAHGSAQSGGRAKPKTGSLRKVPNRADEHHRIAPEDAVFREAGSSPLRSAASTDQMIRLSVSIP